MRIRWWNHDIYTYNIIYILTYQANTYMYPLTHMYVRGTVNELKIQHAHTNSRFNKRKFHERVTCHTLIQSYIHTNTVKNESASHCKKPPLSLPPPMATTTIVLTHYTHSTKVIVWNAESAAFYTNIFY